MRGATWNPMMPRLGVGTALTGVGNTIKFKRVGSAISKIIIVVVER